MNREIFKVSKKIDGNSHMGGSYVTIEGPRFSTRSESRMFRQFSDIIGMTLVPEVNLADEMSMCYSFLMISLLLPCLRICLPPHIEPQWV